MTRSFRHQDRVKIWTRLPDLNTRKNFRTRHPSTSPYKLTLHQLKEWSSFPTDVKNELRAQSPLGEPLKAYKTIHEYMHHRTGSEMCVQAGYVTFVSQAINEAFEKAGLAMRMGDFETGKSSIRGSKIQGRKPDLVIWETKDKTIRVVIEIKTPWTMEGLEGKSRRKFLAARLGIVILLFKSLREHWLNLLPLGQVARYMDDLHCSYGVFTTYNSTWFVRRIDDGTFEVTEPIKASMFSAPSSTSKVPRISVKECFYFIAKMALSEKSVYPNRVGKKLVSYVCAFGF